MVTQYEMQKAATKFFTEVWTEAKKDLNKGIEGIDIMQMMLNARIAEFRDQKFQLTELGNEMMKDGGANERQS